MEKKLRSIVLIIVGVIAICLSIKCYSIKDLNYEHKSTYGGDAYTGIQNAAAATSNNVKELASVVQFGFGSVLLVMGLTLVGVGLTTPTGVKKITSESTPTNTTSTPIEEVKTEA